MATLTLTSKEDSATVTITLEGSINESFLQKSIRIPPNKKIIIDFSHVTSINSIGIRHWIQWIRTYLSSEYIFRNCPQCIVDQMNSVSDFIPTQCHIESFFVPYYSEDTGEEKQILYKHNEDYFDGKPITPKRVQDSVGREMEIDTPLQKYFKFLTTKRGA